MIIRLVARRWHRAAYNPATNRMIIYGGQDSSGITLSDVWVLTNGNGIGGSPPGVQLQPAVAGPASVLPVVGYDASNNRLIVFATIAPSGQSPQNQSWVLTNADGVSGTPSWMQLIPAPMPSPVRGSSVGVYDAISNQFIIFAGCDSQ